MRTVWREEEDVLLAETVLRHIREGSGLMNALDELEKKLNRPASSCGFRWSSFVRHNYVNELDIAKQQRKVLIKALTNQTINDNYEALKKLED